LRKINTIVCATRGGEGSRAVQFEAIRRAKEEKLPLVFLYVLDTSIVGQLDKNMMTAVRSELTWLGKALVNAAQQRARSAKVDAEVVIREGELKEEICSFIKESNASMLLLGAPRGTTATVFGDDAVEKFASSVQNETGVPVHVIRPEKYEKRVQQNLLIAGNDSFEANSG